MSAWQETEFGRIPSHWDYLRIENTDLQIGDGNYSSKYPRASELLAEGIPFISSTDLSNGKISADNLRYISTEHHSRLLKGHIKQGDVLIVVRGNGVGQVGLVSEKYEDANLNAQMAYLGRSNKIDGAFLYYLLSKYYSDGVTETVVSGSAQPQITVGSLKQLSLIVPPVDEQKAVAAILSSLDDKIDLLHRQNKTLEAMAASLFRQWFVEEAQEDWEEVKLGDFFPVVTGKKDANFSTDDGEYPFFTCSQTAIKAPSFSFDGAAILLSGNGDFNVKRYIGKFEAYQRTYVLFPYDVKYYSFLFTLMRYYLSDITGGHQGSVINFITKSMITDFTFSMPKDRGLISEKLEQFNEIYEKVDSNMKQIRTLEKLRDNLLPKLMSGEVRVACH